MKSTSYWTKGKGGKGGGAGIRLAQGGAVVLCPPSGETTVLKETHNMKRDQQFGGGGGGGGGHVLVSIHTEERDLREGVGGKQGSTVRAKGCTLSMNGQGTAGLEKKSHVE